MRHILFLFLLAIVCWQPLLATNPVEKSPTRTITITIDADGFAYIGRDTINIDKLAAELQQRLWKSWLGTGKMFDSIRIIFSGEVLMGVRGSALDAIKEGQDRALKEICIQQYKRTYERLTSSQRRKVKKQFPVLFQELHW